MRYTHDRGIFKMHKDLDITFEKNIKDELSIQDFLNVGLDQIAYIRKAKTDDDTLNENDYIVYGADGSQISIMDSYDTALVAAQLNDLFAVTVH